MTVASVTTLAQLLDLYDRFGDEPYGEDVSQTSHALQCAALAEEAGASSTLVAAALLHDVGHLLAGARDKEWDDAVDDDRHEATGARVLAVVLGRDVAAPVALHVLAKRWRCAVEPGYLEALSAVSRASLVAQGGPLRATERTRFEASRSFDDAVALRGWDDRAKDPSGRSGSIRAYEEMLADLAGRSGAAGG